MTFITSLTLISMLLLPSYHFRYTINGSKSFISGAGMSNLYLVMCKTQTDGKEGISCFLIPKETKGLSFGANEK